MRNRVDLGFRSCDAYPHKDAEGYYALTISIYASEEIQQKAKRGENWMSPDALIVDVVHVGKGKEWIAQKFYEAAVTAMGNPLAFEITVFRQFSDPAKRVEVLIAMSVKHVSP